MRNIMIGMESPSQVMSYTVDLNAEELKKYQQAAEQSDVLISPVQADKKLADGKSTFRLETGVNFQRFYETLNQLEAPKK